MRKFRTMVTRAEALKTVIRLRNLRGETPFVDPGPPFPKKVAQHGRDVRRRFVAEPRRAGPWQFSGRSDLVAEESVRLELRYVENWSLTLDSQILWKAWSAVIRGAGA